MTRTVKRDTTLCRSTCSYYKPGKNEEMMCQGFIVVHRMLVRGKRLPFTPSAGAPAPSAGTFEGLRKRVCAVCSFERADCDFILTGGAAAPCGGVALLAHLLESGEVSFTEIDEAA